MNNSKWVILFLILQFNLVFANDGMGVEKTRPTTWYKEVKTGPLQMKLDALSVGETLTLTKGVYQGPIHIKKDGITIKGEAGVVIDGNEQGSVIVIEATDVTVEGLSLNRSGQSYDQTDSGISIRSGSNIKILNNHLKDCLFGIDAHSGKNILISGNTISSQNIEIGLRGDAIRLWNINGAKIMGNHWSYSRDAVVWYSKNIVFNANTGSYSRYSIHSMYSQAVTIQNNNFFKNQVGIFLMYGSNFVLYGNTISSSLGPTGMGIGLKESSNILVQNNTINYSSVGILVDNTPYVPESKSRILGNTLSFNGRAVLLSHDLPGGEFKRNHFIGNLEDVATENRNGSQSIWDKNFWDGYIGFDTNNDNIGDQPFVVEKVEESFKEDYPDAAIFYGSPLFVLINLIKKVVNVGKPKVILIDKNPQLVNI